MLPETQFLRDLLQDLCGYVLDRYQDRAGRSIQSKTDPADLLTETDLQVQRRVHAALGRHFPGDILVGEEGDAARFPADRDARCWVLDPVDGTYNFVRGLLPAFGITLAFAQGGLPVAGCVVFPKLGEFFLAEKGKGATRNGKPTFVSRIDDLAAAKIEIDFGRLARRPDTLRQAHRLLQSGGQIRCHGCCTASMCDVAAGEGECFLHFALSPWDYAASALLIQEAGGIVTRADGSPIHLFDGKKSILASNAVLHPRILALLD